MSSIYILKMHTITAVVTLAPCKFQVLWALLKGFLYIGNPCIDLHRLDCIDYQLLHLLPHALHFHLEKRNSEVRSAMCIDIWNLL